MLLIKALFFINCKDASHRHAAARLPLTGPLPAEVHCRTSHDLLPAVGKLAEIPFPSVFRTVQKIDNKKVAAGERHAEQVGDQHGQCDARKRGAVQFRHDKRGPAGAFFAAEETLHLVPRDVVPVLLTPRRRVARLRRRPVPRLDMDILHSLHQLRLSFVR